jgi:hypothetical protein
MYDEELLLLLREGHQFIVGLVGLTVESDGLTFCFCSLFKRLRRPFRDIERHFHSAADCVQALIPTSNSLDLFILSYSGSK